MLATTVIDDLTRKSNWGGSLPQPADPLAMLFAQRSGPAKTQPSIVEGMRAQ